MIECKMKKYLPMPRNGKKEEYTPSANKNIQ